MIHERVSPRTLGIVRAVVFTLWACVVGFDSFEELAWLPPSIFQTHGLLALLPGGVWSVVLREPFLLGFRAVLVVLLGLAALGARPYRPIALLAVLGVLLEQTLIRGFGFIQHRELALLLAAVVLALFPSADGFSRWGREDAHAPAPLPSAALTLMTLLILLAYMITGLYRLAYAGPEIFLSNSLRYYIAYTSFRQNYYPFELGQVALLYPTAGAVLNAGFVVVTVLEILAPLCLFSRRFRRLWLGVMVPFHVATLFLMKIFFWQNLVLLVLLLAGVERMRPSRATARATPAVAHP